MPDFRVNVFVFGATDSIGQELIGHESVRVS